MNLLFSLLIQLALYSKAEAIVGGVRGLLEDIPYQVSIQVQDPNDVFYHYCGGIIVSNISVLTSASCLYIPSSSGVNVIPDANRLRVVSNTTNINIVNETVTGVIHLVDKITLHYRYSVNYKRNDIALLILKEQFNFTSTTRPIAIRKGRTKTGEFCILSGFGTANTTDTGDGILKRVLIPITDHETCENRYGSILTNKMVCAGQFKKDFCKGDIGGPLVCNGDLVGVAIFNRECGIFTGITGVYTETSVFRDWIMRNHSFSAKGSISCIILMYILTYFI